jgi:DNA-binding transcriptional LysR family regulator
MVRCSATIVAYRVENVMLLLALVAAGLGIALAPALPTQVVEQIGNLVVEGIEAGRQVELTLRSRYLPRLFGERLLGLSVSQ